MTNIIFSGIDKAFFDSLIFNNQVSASWLSVDELMSAGSEIDSGDAKFVVLYSSPEVFLAALGHEAISNLDQAEQQWLPQTELLTQLYLAHKDNALLVDSEQCEVNFEDFTTLLNRKFNIDSQLSNTCNIDGRLNNQGAELLIQSLQLTFVTALCDNYDIQSTYENVVSAADLLAVSNGYSPEDRAINQRDKCRRLVKKIETKYSEYTGLVKDNDLSSLQVKQLQELLEIAFNEQKTSEKQLALSKKASDKVSKELSTIQKSNNQLAQDKSTLENDTKGLSAKNELLLMQVQQLQEELETGYHQLSKSEGQLALDKEASAKVADALSSIQKNNNQITQDKSNLENDIVELNTGNELSLLQIQQLQEELETVYHQQKTSEEKLAFNKDDSAKAADELFAIQKSNNQLAQDKSTLKNDLKELSAENDLSLSLLQLQVQQLQEELEMACHQQKTSAEKLAINKANSDKIADKLLAIQKVKNQLTKDNSKLAQDNSKLAQDKSKLEHDKTGLSAEKKLTLLQVKQLQEESEAVFSQNKILEIQLKDTTSKQKELEQNNLQLKTNNEQSADFKGENEIALLQIQQLQQELEFYFIKYQSLSANSIINRTSPMSIVDRRFEKSLTLRRLTMA
jgi:hypothetical protein